ncbi:MAG: protein arginine kinase [Clostridia bacterium]|nr:protein arginine kinase [Clostridia bacterium]
MNWYLQSGNDSDVVLSTRIRFARNLKELPFVSKCTKKDSEEILRITENAINKLGYGLKFFKLKDLDDITKLSLIEKHLVSPEFILKRNDTGAIAINDDENICMMFNEEDHIRMQAMSAGLDLENTLNLLVEIDEKQEEILNYAYNDKYGFLTSCPTNAGTGMRASVMVHLPALTQTKNIGKVLNIVNSFDMNIRGIYGEGSKSQGNMYQISNKQTLGISEKEIIKNLKIIIDKVVEQERLARKLLEKNQIELEDNVYRAFGILSNCKKITSEECKNLLSKVRLGTDLGIIKEITDLKVNKLETYTKPGNLQKFLGEKLEGYERDIKRAEVIKQIINE